MATKAMTELWTLISFSLLIAVVLYPLLSRLIPSPRHAVFTAMVIGIVDNVLLRGASFNLMLVAILEPLPVTMMVYGVAYLARPFGLALQPWLKIELVITILAGLLLMLSGTGVLPIDIYRYGYEPQPVTIMAVCLALLALWRKHVLLSLSVPLALTLWLFDIASSNFFDLVFHVLWFVPLLYRLGVSNSSN
jgi:hypothetical protein